MKVFNIFDLLGGLAVFLFGMLMMNDNLTAFAGSRLRDIMAKLTKNKLRGYLTGFGVTILNQSSSATTVLEAVLVGAGLMTFEQSIPVTLGAELGSTVLGQLFAFPKITRLATLFVAAGFFAFLLSKNKKQKSLANTMLGFGLLFLGMDIMTKSMEPLRHAPLFLDLMKNIEEPILGILVGLVFTMIIQSSGATSGLVIALAISGAITVEQAVPINLGASIGTCITAILGSMSLNREAKRSAYIHLAFQTMGVTFAFLLLMIPWQGERLYIVLAKELTALITGSRSNVARQIAMAHTLMPLINHAFVFPLLPWIVKAFNRVMPPEPPAEVFGPQFLNETMLVEPAVALIQTRKEIIRMGTIVGSMLEHAASMLVSRDPELGKQIKKADKMVDTLRMASISYLTRIAKHPLSEQESKTQIAYLFLASELENLADVVERNVLDRIKKLLNRDMRLSDEGCEDILSLFSMTRSRFSRFMQALETEDLTPAIAVLEEADHMRQLLHDLRERHFRRLNDGLAVSLETTEIHIDLLSHLYRINKHISHMARTLVELEKGTCSSLAPNDAVSS
ncbi:MAG: Na/Pi cotransporter family protein [Rectinemataceae bacterium]|nr:Na/Pi cotransporter family protein [Spirochaetaceae bacterium]